VEYFRTLAGTEEALHIDRLRRTRDGEDLTVSGIDPHGVQQVLNELLAREVSLIAPDGLRCDYGNGTAQVADEIHTTVHGPARS
jgi:hypothetical protein